MKTKIRHLAAPGLLALGLALAGSTSSVIAQSSVVSVPPPQVQDYWVSISRQTGGILVFDGYAPSDAVRSALSETPDADISFLKLGSGAPANYNAAVEFGLSTLKRLSEGRFSLRDSVITISGVAATQADFLNLAGPQAPKPPAGLILAKSEISAPRENNYTFSLRKLSNGNVVASGFVPRPELEQTILAAIGPGSSSTLRFGSGEPVNFAATIDKALPLLDRLAEGQIEFANNSWLMSGSPKSSRDAEAIRSDFADEKLAETGWSLSLSEPAAPAPTFTWQLEKLGSGSVVMTGSVPTEAFKRVIGLRLGDQLQDQSSTSENAPDGFITKALAAADALKLLASGTVSYDGTTWSISGEGAAADAQQQVSQALVAQDSDWTIAVTDPVAAPAAAAVSTPEPADSQPVAAAAETTPPAIADPVASAAPETAPAATEPAPLSASAAPVAEDIEACSATLSQLSAQNGILFKSGAAVLADGTGAILQAMATAANQCPSLALDVAGHTDSDGDASANLALSVARAEAVINALIALGVDPSRLYALGYGDAQPVADNNTQSGKAQNRRIVVSVRQPD